MIVFRLVREKYKNELSGYGASLNDQRWNSKGTKLVYTAGNRALAFCEVSVHLPLGILPKDYWMISIDIPESIKIQELKSDILPDDWKAMPHRHHTRKIGDEFVQKNLFPVLKVPSAVVEGDFNYILNPRHDKFDKIQIIKAEPFPFDSRYFGR